MGSMSVCILAVSSDEIGCIDQARAMSVKIREARDTAVDNRDSNSFAVNMPRPNQRRINCVCGVIERPFNRTIGADVSDIGVLGE